MNLGRSAGVDASGSDGDAFAIDLLRAFRPRQWVKNLLVFAALIFGQRLSHPASVVMSIYAFVVFCGLSSAVYLVNDVLDREADRHHPLKSRRPIASGAIGAGAALITSAVLTGAGLTAAFMMAPAFGLVAATYILLMTL